MPVAAMQIAYDPQPKVLVIGRPYRWDYTLADSDTGPLDDLTAATDFRVTIGRPNASSPPTPVVWTLTDGQISQADGIISLDVGDTSAIAAGEYEELLEIQWGADGWEVVLRGIVKAVKAP